MPSRLVMIDDNIQGPSGHYLELAQLLACAAKKKGISSILATHHRFTADETTESLCDTYPLFHTNGMVRWSLGASGSSTFAREITGKIDGNLSIASLLRRFSESIRPPMRRPAKMLMEWKNSFHQLLEIIEINEDDLVLLNTADDFTFLALAAALQDWETPSLNCHALFHFAINDNQSIDGKRKNQYMRQQFNTALTSLKNHRVHIHTTTDELKRDMNLLMGYDFSCSVPYPSRKCEVSGGLTSVPCKAMLAGMPRGEKGKHSIHRFLKELERQQLISSSAYQPSLQLPEKRWKSMIPKSMHSDCRSGRIDLVTKHLSTTDYQKWLHRSGIGIFLYDPIRYRSRCSGVLLEMLCRGVPVIVPDRCWLSGQVEQAGGHGSIGYIYRNEEDVPSLMNQFLTERDAITKRARDYASVMMQNHLVDNSLNQMGLLKTEES